MSSTIYLSKNDNFENFICNVQDDDSKKVSIYNGAGAIARESFKNDSSVEVVEVSESVERIEESAFENCKELKNIIFGRKDEFDSTHKNIFGVQIHSCGGKIEVQKNAFKNCDKLTTVIFPKGTESTIVIERDAFYGCRNLRTVVILGYEQVYIDKYAFLGCKNLTFIYDKNSSIETYVREHGLRYVNV